jgi:hypothetical protein
MTTRPKDSLGAWHKNETSGAAMSSWWEFAEHSGYDGEELALWRITCGFCNEQGNFEKTHHSERKNTAGKKLNYDIYKCTNCGNLTMIFWSVAIDSGSRGMHDFKCVPWPRQTTSFPGHWPEDVGRNWLQARRSLESKNWDAAALMARSAVQLVMRYQKAKGNNLKDEIDDLANKGILPPVMKEWSHEVRVLGNENAHPKPGDKGTTQKDATDAVEFLAQLLVLIYNLPYEIEQYRERRKGKD